MSKVNEALRQVKKDWTISVLAIEDLEEELAEIECETIGEARQLQVILDMVDDTLRENNVLLYDEMVVPRYNLFPLDVWDSGLGRSEKLIDIFGRTNFREEPKGDEE